MNATDEKSNSSGAAGRFGAEYFSSLLMDTDWTGLAGGDGGDRERSARLALLNLARENGMRAMGKIWAAGVVHLESQPKQVFTEILDMVERSDLGTFEVQINALLNRPDATP